MLIRTGVTYGDWIISMGTLSNGQSDLVCSVLPWFNDQTQRKWTIWNFYWQAMQSQKFLELAIWDKSGKEKFCCAAWINLERKIWRPYVIINIKLEFLLHSGQVMPLNSSGLINFLIIVANLVNVLKQVSKQGDVQKILKLYLTGNKLPQIINGLWWFNCDDKDEQRLNLIRFDTWKFVDEAFSNIKGFQLQNKTGQHNHFMFADVSDTMCAVVYPHSQTKENSVDLSIEVWKCSVARLRHFSIPRLELQVAFMWVTLKEQKIKEHETKIHSCSGWSDSTAVLQWRQSSHRKQIFVANPISEILDKNDISQW